MAEETLSLFLWERDIFQFGMPGVHTSQVQVLFFLLPEWAPQYRATRLSSGS